MAALAEPNNKKVSFGDVEISEVDGYEEDHGLRTPSTADTDTFYDEFTEKVSIKTIMSGSRSIGRNEARLMLAQFRSCHLEVVTFQDPAVLMLDGLPLSELEDFLISGGDSLETAIRGDLSLNTTDTRNAGRGSQQPRATLDDLRGVLESFRTATKSSDKDRFRGEFFVLCDSVKGALPETLRAQIAETAQRDAGAQEMLLMTIELPRVEEKQQPQEEEYKGDVGGGYGESHGEGYMARTGTSFGGTSFGGTTSPGFGERYRRSMGGIDDYQMRKNSLRSQVVVAQSKNLRAWLFSNLGSQHVWFFMFGFVLFWIFFIQTWVDYAYGEMWRAMLMELLCLASILMMLMEADTEFIRMQLQERLYNYYQFLGTIEGRTAFYTILCFLAFGKFTVYDAMAIIGGQILLLLTITRWVLYQLSETAIDDFVITLSDSALIRAKFRELDTEQVGFLTLSDVDNMVDPEYAKCCCCRGWLKEIIFWRMDGLTNDGKIDIHEFVQFCLEFRENQEIGRQRRDSKQEKMLRVQAESTAPKQTV